MTARRLTALLLATAAFAAKHCLKPQLGSEKGHKRDDALQDALGALDDGVCIEVTFDGQRRYAQFLDAETGACDGIAAGTREDGCYALRPDGKGLDLAGLRKARDGTRSMRDYGYAPLKEDRERIPKTLYGWAHGPRQQRKQGGLSQLTLFGGGGAQVQPADQPYHAINDKIVASVSNRADAESTIFVVHPNALRLLFFEFLCKEGFAEGKMSYDMAFPGVDEFAEELKKGDLLDSTQIQELTSLLSSLYKEPIGQVLVGPAGVDGDVYLRRSPSDDATREPDDAEHALVIRGAASSWKILAKTEDGKKLLDATVKKYGLEKYIRFSSSISSGASGATDPCLDAFEGTAPSKRGPLRRKYVRRMWGSLSEALDDLITVFTRKGGDAGARTKKAFLKQGLWPQAKGRYITEDADNAAKVEALGQLLNDFATVAAKDLDLGKKYCTHLRRPPPKRDRGLRRASLCLY